VLSPSFGLGPLPLLIASHSLHQICSVCDGGVANWLFTGPNTKAYSTRHLFPLVCSATGGTYPSPIYDCHSSRYPSRPKPREWHFQLPTGLPRGPHPRPSTLDFLGTEQDEPDADGEDYPELLNLTLIMVWTTHVGMLTVCCRQHSRGGRGERRMRRQTLLVRGVPDPSTLISFSATACDILRIRLVFVELLTR